MSKKAFKPLIITAVVLILIVAAYYVIQQIPEAGPGDVTPTPTVSKAPDNFPLFSGDYYDLERMEFEFRDGSEIVINIDDSGDARLFDIQQAKQGWTYSQETMRATAFNIISVSALAKVAENVTDFKDYELDSPTLTARAIFGGDDGKTVHEIQIGKMTSLQDSYYARLKGESTVYAVSKYIVQNLMTTELQYREMSFFPSYLSEDQMSTAAAGFITYIRVRNPDNGQDIEILRRSDEELDKLPLGSTRYRMDKPVKSECNDTNIDDKLINVAAAIKILGVVEDDPADLAKYGLDVPLDIWMTNTDGTEIHYLIGDSNGTNAYVMVEGTNSVLMAEQVAPVLRDLNYLDYMFKLLWLHNIDNVKSIVFDMQGEKRLLEIRDNTKNAEGKVVSFEAILDGRPITETNTRRLFSRMLNMMILGDLEESFDLENEMPEYTFTVTMTDGSTNELRLYSLNERQYAASVNGAEVSFYINVRDIRNLEEAFDYVDRGEEIPR